MEEFTLSPHGVTISNDLNNIIFNSIELSVVASRIYNECMELMANDVSTTEIYAHMDKQIALFNDFN